MYTLVLIVVCLTLVVLRADASHLDSEASMRTGRPIPLHIPTQTVNSNDTFEVPYWLGAYYATVDISSDWTLPLTIGNGGQTYPGEFLFIRNYGPESITLYPSEPETIEGTASYVIPAGAVIEILSGYPNWVVVTPSVNVSIATGIFQTVETQNFIYQGVTVDPGQLQYMHMFEGNDVSASDAAYTVEIGPDTYNAPPYNTCADPSTCANWQVVSIGRSAGQYNTGYRVNNFGHKAGQYNVGINSNNLGAGAGQNNVGANTNNMGVSAGLFNTGGQANNLGNLAGKNNSGSDVNNLGSSAGEVNTGDSVNNLGLTAGMNNMGSYVNNLGILSGQYNQGNHVSNLGHSSGKFNTGTNVNNFGNNAGSNNTGQAVNNIGPFAGQLNNGSYCSHNGHTAGAFNTFNHCYTNGRNSACTAPFQFVFGAMANPLHLRLPSDTGTYCVGVAYDTCLGRGRAGAFELPSGQDLYSTGYVCAGAGCTLSAPAATSTGIYDSNTRVVRSCTSGTGITCSVTDGVLTVSANANLQNTDEVAELRAKLSLLESRIEKLLQLVGV